jgi:hypothetical protein
MYVCMYVQRESKALLLLLLFELCLARQPCKNITSL